MHKSSKPGLILFFWVILVSLLLPDGEKVYKIFFFENPIGFERYLIEPATGNTIVCKINSELTFNRADSIVKIEKNGVFVEDALGKPLRFEYSQFEDDRRVQINGRVENGTLRVQKNGQTKEIPLAADFVFYNSLNRLIKKNIKKNRKEFSFSFYSPDFDNVIKVKNFVTHIDNDFIRLKAVYENVPDVFIFEKRDLEGNLLEQDIPGLKVRKVRVTQNASVRKTTEEKPVFFDAYRFNAIDTEDRRKKIEANPSTIYYRLLLDDEVNIPQDDRQTIIRRVDNEIHLEVKSNRHLNNTGTPLDERDRNRYLRNNRFLKYDEQSISTVLKGIIEVKSSPDRVMKPIPAVHDWIIRYVRTSNLQLCFGDAPGVLKRKQGDCSEFSVLFTALLRAYGVPTRICFGAIYLGGLFRYHFWIEYFDEKWVPFDPISSTGRVNLYYIKFAEVELNDKTRVELGLELSRFLNIRKIELMEENSIRKSEVLK